MKKNTLIGLFFLLAAPFLAAQNEGLKHDYNWVLGYKRLPDSMFVNRIDFRKSPVEISKYPVVHWPARSPCPMSDKDGNLILFANGCELRGPDGNVLINGDQITPDQWIYDSYCPDYYPFTGSWMMLPDPGNDTLYYLFAIGHRNIPNIIAWGVYASRLSTQEIFEKNTLVCADSVFGGHLTACRHANGRDWWLLFNKITTNSYYTYLLDPLGIHLTEIQDIGAPTPWLGSGSGQCAFSPDGTRYVHYNNVTDMYVYDFDRCNGQLSNFRQVNISYNEDTGNSFGGMAISPNSRFAYTFGYKYAFQVDLNAPDLQATVTQVAYWDSTYVNGIWKTTFSKAALGPDGKIYDAVPGSNPYLHIIHNPDAKGDSCHFEQHALLLPFMWNQSDIVNFPNYRLGRLAGSVCDSLFTAASEPDAGNNIPLIFPNPNTGRFRMKLPAEDQEDWRFELLDSSGRRLGPVELRDGYCDLDGLPSGWYVLVCRRLSDGRRFYKALVLRS